MNIKIAIWGSSRSATTSTGVLALTIALLGCSAGQQQQAETAETVAVEPETTAPVAEAASETPGHFEPVILAGEPTKIADVTSCLSHYSGKTNVTDATHPFAVASREAILASGKISSTYFDSHFRFVCASIDENGSNDPTWRSARFVVEIGEYQVVLEDSEDDRGRLYDFGWKGEMLREIGEVLPRSEALEQLRACASAPLTRGEALLTDVGLFLRASTAEEVVWLNFVSGECQVQPQIGRSCGSTRPDQQAL